MIEINKKEDILIPFNKIGDSNWEINTKEIYYYDHDEMPYLTKMFDTVDDYLKGCLIFAQNDFSESREIDNWTEEIVVDLFDERTVKKWRY